MFYQTQYTDPTSGDVLMQSRWYTPGTATFRSRDTYSGNLNTPVSLNRYTYAHNNPIRYSDPTGLCVELWVPACANAGTMALAEQQFRDNYTLEELSGGGRSGYRWESETVVATAADLMIAAGYGSQSCLMEPGSYCATNVVDLVQSSGLPFELVALHDVDDRFFPVDNPDTLQYFGPDLSLEQVTGPQAFRDLVFDYEACGIGGGFSPGWCGFEAATMFPFLKLGKGLKAGKGLTFAGRVAALRTGFAGAGHAGAAQLDELFQTTKAFCSFSGETGVLMADGTIKPISEVEIGDTVTAFDPETGERGEREVTALWIHEDTLVDLEIDSATVTTTEDHPFWNHTDQQWQRADQLDSGDYVLTAGGDLLEVDGINPEIQYSGTAYNLTINDIHTYYVAVGDEQVLVHNTCGNVFPATADEMTDALGVPAVHTTTISGTPRTRWQPNDRTRITMESHPDGVHLGDASFNPRHHGVHFHVQIRPNANTGWNNPAVIKVQPPGYTPGVGTGFLPGERFPS